MDPSISRDWLLKGHFDFDGQNPRKTTTMQIRDELCTARALPTKSLVIANFPSGQARKHTYWWRDTELEYGEAQFVAAVSKLHAILSLGVSVEKGVTAATARRREEIMDPNTWDWSRVVDGLSSVLTQDIPSIAEAITEPVHVRIRSGDRTIAEGRAWHTRAFSFVQDQWFERHVERVRATPEDIVDYVHALNGQPDTWVILQFVRDLSADQADNKSPATIAAMLMQFDGLRRRLRP
jgi:hypothetical protein